MIIMSLTTLAANALIELNKKNEVRKIYLKDVMAFNNALKEEANNNSLDYIGQIDSVYLYELRFNYSAFFDFYEDEHGYVISLKNNINILDIKENFRLHNNELLLSLLENLDLEEIFGISEKNRLNIKKLDKI